MRREALSSVHPGLIPHSQSVIRVSIIAGLLQHPRFGCNIIECSCPLKLKADRSGASPLLPGRTGSPLITGVDSMAHSAALLQPRWHNEVLKTVTDRGSSSLDKWSPQQGPGRGKSAVRRKPLGGRLFLRFRHRAAQPRVYPLLRVGVKSRERVHDGYTNTSSWHTAANTKIWFNTLTSL